MKALNTLRNLILLLAFAVVALDAAATDGPKSGRCSPVAQGGGKAGAKTAIAGPTRTFRKMAAAFVDPTLPLAELVECERAERTGK